MGGSTRAAGPAMARQAVLAHTRNPGARGRRLAEENGVDAVFTGIVEELGEVVALEELPDAARLTVRGPLVTAGAGAGDSIAVNGVCLTVTGASDGTFSADVMGETLSRSSLSALGTGSAVNLERPLRLDGRLGGHLVQGHVDGLGQIAERLPQGDWETVLFTCSVELAQQMVPKGSVAVDGVSLTLVDVLPERFSVALIPHTLAHTTLGLKPVGAAVNLETDLLAKYVWKCLHGATSDAVLLAQPLRAAGHPAQGQAGTELPD